jgi:hypothetical protein
MTKQLPLMGQSLSPVVKEKRPRLVNRLALWRGLTLTLTLVCLALAAVLGVTLYRQKMAQTQSKGAYTSIPCPTPQDGGLLTSGQPLSPSPFHELTLSEYRRLMTFLRQQPHLNLSAPDHATISTSNVFMVDLMMPNKQKTLDFLDKQGPQPPREARVVVYRGDKSVPVVEE